MTSAFFDEFPALWDSFEVLLKENILEWLRKETLTRVELNSRKLCNIYSNMGWEYWVFGQSDSAKKHRSSSTLIPSTPPAPLFDFTFL